MAEVFGGDAAQLGVAVRVERLPQLREQRHAVGAELRREPARKFDSNARSQAGLIGGALVALWLEPPRVTEDIAVVGAAPDSRREVVLFRQAFGPTRRCSSC